MHVCNAHFEVRANRATSLGHLAQKFFVVLGSASLTNAYYAMVKTTGLILLVSFPVDISEGAV